MVVLILIRRYLFWFDFFLTDEMANLQICQIQWWICESSPCHTSSVWPWSDAPKVLSYGTKVPLYGTYLDGLRHILCLNRCGHFFLVYHTKKLVDCSVLVFQKFVQGIILVPRLVHNEHASCIVIINRKMWLTVHSFWHQDPVLVSMSAFLSLFVEY